MVRSYVMKLFISQGMRGKTNEDILAERNKAIKIFKEMFSNEDIEVLDSFFKDDIEPEDVSVSGVWWLGKSLELLAKADVAYFVDGWQDYRGCRIEHTVCKEYGIKTIGKGV